MSSRELDSRNRNTVRTYFPNGIVYSSAVYEDNKIVVSREGAEKMFA